MTSIFNTITEKKLQKALEKIAIEDFEKARGTAHIKLLKDARERWVKQLDTIKGRLLTFKQEIENTSIEMTGELNSALALYIVETHISEVSGIGPKLRQILIDNVFIDSLSDLRYAHKVPGIGESKQFLINQWIARYEGKFTVLMKQDFPGKTDIVGEAKKNISECNTKLKALEGEHNKVEKKISLIDDTLKGIMGVTKDDFLRARINPTDNNYKLTNYISGVFPEWEPMPNWFKEIIEVKDGNIR